MKVPLKHVLGMFKEEIYHLNSTKSCHRPKFLHKGNLLVLWLILVSLGLLDGEGHNWLLDKLFYLKDLAVFSFQNWKV